MIAGDQTARVSRSRLLWMTETPRPSIPAVLHGTLSVRSRLRSRITRPHLLLCELSKAEQRSNCDSRNTKTRNKQGCRKDSTKVNRPSGGKNVPVHLPEMSASPVGQVAQTPKKKLQSDRPPSTRNKVTEATRMDGSIIECLASPHLPRLPAT